MAALTNLIHTASRNTPNVKNSEFMLFIIANLKMLQNLTPHILKTFGSVFPSLTKVPPNYVTLLLTRCEGEIFFNYQEFFKSDHGDGIISLQKNYL